MAGEKKADMSKAAAVRDVASAHVATEPLDAEF